jgi:hypothetical protein
LSRTSFRSRPRSSRRRRGAGDDVLRGDFIFEPEPEQILERLLPVYLETQVYRALLESTASEQGARMTAMRNASKNAGELIDSLTLSMNRARQAEITQEILEVVAGAEADLGPIPAPARHASPRIRRLTTDGFEQKYVTRADGDAVARASSSERLRVPGRTAERFVGNIETVVCSKRDEMGSS